jgi:hypothetical protein
MAPYREEPVFAVIDFPKRHGQRVSILVWANGAIAVCRNGQWSLGMGLPDTVDETLSRLLAAGFFAKDASESHVIPDDNWTTIWACHQSEVTVLLSSHEFYKDKKGVVFTERGVSLRSSNAARSPSPRFERFLDRWEAAKHEILAFADVKLRPCDEGHDLLERWRRHVPTSTCNDLGLAGRQDDSRRDSTKP